jgi:hypothetical protein
MQDLIAQRSGAATIQYFSIVYAGERIDRLEDKNGKPYETAELWGVCDGTKNYMRIRDEFGELILDDKGFRVFSYATLSEAAGSSGGYDLMSGTFGKLKSGIKVRQYFDLDMETGRFYLQEIFGKSSISLQ